MGKLWRVRDPIHGLITFSDEQAQIVWDLLHCKELQRLRRIKQLGFSDIVYPGATHTRFAHSVGVYHNARRLHRIIRDRHPEVANERRELVSLCAALLHDAGHGPFSHTFEGLTKQLGHRKEHEDWTIEIIKQDTEVNNRLNQIDDKISSEISEIIKETESSDIYGSIISSQFDADRLDYLVRDRQMTGVEIGHFDFDWLLDCLEVDDIYVGQKK